MVETPRIHLNGTSSDSLLESVSRSIESLRESVSKLEEMSPNARDYYVKGPESFQRAVNEHDQRIRSLRTVMKELVEIQESILDQIS